MALITSRCRRGLISADEFYEALTTDDLDKPEMTYYCFKRSLFELADVWCREVSEAAYLAFLNSIFGGIVELSVRSLKTPCLGPGGVALRNRIALAPPGPGPCACLDFSSRSNRSCVCSRSDRSTLIDWRAYVFATRRRPGRCSRGCTRT